MDGRWRDRGLTVVLPVHGRAAFVDRFMGLGLPFRVMRLEGEGFLDKIAAGVERVATPYAMLADCDDFPQENGVLRCMDWLEEHPDYVCCSGKIKGIWLFPSKLWGPIGIHSRQYAPYDTSADYGQVGVNERVLAGFANSWSWYAVYRTEALKVIWREIAELGFTDYMVMEKFAAMRCLTLGKALSFPDFTSLVRQYGTSQVAATRSDWLRTYSSHDRFRVMDRMTGLGVDPSRLHELWERWYVERYQTFYGHPVRKWFGQTFPFLRWFSPLLEICR